MTVYATGPWSLLPMSLHNFNYANVYLRGGSCAYDAYTVKPALSGHSKLDKTKILKTNGSLMEVESIAECYFWSILQYF